MDQSILSVLNRFLKWDTKTTPSPDQEMEIEEELNRLRALAYQRELVGKYIKDRKERIVRELANLCDDRTCPDSVIRAMAGRLREVSRWDQDIFLAESQSKQLSGWFKAWKNRAKR